MKTDDSVDLGIYDGAIVNYVEAYVTIRPNRPATVMDVGKQHDFSYRKLFEATSKEERPGDLVLLFRAAKESVALEAVDALRKALASQGETFVRFRIAKFVYDTAQ